MILTFSLPQSAQSNNFRVRHTAITILETLPSRGKHHKVRVRNYRF